MRRLNSQPQRSRKGMILSVELIMVLPILLLVLLAMVEFSLITTAHAKANNVAQTASRELLATPKSPSQIRVAIQRMLGPKWAYGAIADIEFPDQTTRVGKLRLVIPMRNVTPDLLWMTGFSVQGRFVVGEAPLIGAATRPPNSVVQK